jgi:pilus assembly protein CpaF
MTTGNDGSLSTGHANTAVDMLRRLETMVLMTGYELPLRAIREQVAGAFDLMVHQSRFRDGSRRVTHVTEVVGMEGDVVTLQDLFLFDYAAGYSEDGAPLGTLKSTGLRPKFLDKLAAHGIHVDTSIFAFEKFGG